MQDVMVDIETTGTGPDRAAILQIAAVQFDLRTRRIGEVFNRCMFMPPTRAWDEATRSWWMKQRSDVMASIMTRMEEPAVVMQAFQEWCMPSNTLRFWSKPSHFDYVFVSGYFRDFGLDNPFHYRQATDLNSFLRGMYAPDPMPELDVPFVGDAHDAIYDAAHQIKILFKHMERKDSKEGFVDR